MRPQGEVVVRVKPALRFGGAAGIGMFAVGIWWAAAMSVMTGQADWPIRSMHANVAGVVALWVIVTPVGFALTYLALFLLLQKQTFSARGASVRTVFRTRELPFESLTMVDFQGYSIHSGLFRVQAERVRVHSNAGGRYPLRAVLQGGLTHVDEAMAVIEGWVRRNPDLVAGSNAQRYFVDRGVIAPQADAGTDQLGR